jgi:hypothetical protein
MLHGASLDIEQHACRSDTVPGVLPRLLLLLSGLVQRLATMSMGPRGCKTVVVTGAALHTHACHKTDVCNNSVARATLLQAHWHTAHRLSFIIAQPIADLSIQHMKGQRTTAPTVPQGSPRS